MKNYLINGIAPYSNVVIVIIKEMEERMGFEPMLTDLQSDAKPGSATSPEMNYWMDILVLY